MLEFTAVLSLVVSVVLSSVSVSMGVVVILLRTLRRFSEFCDQLALRSMSVWFSSLDEEVSSKEVACELIDSSSEESANMSLSLPKLDWHLRDWESLPLLSDFDVEVVASLGVGCFGVFSFSLLFLSPLGVGILCFARFPFLPYISANSRVYGKGTLCFSLGICGRSVG